MAEMSLQTVLHEIKENNLLAIRFEQTVTSGVARCKTVHANRFEHFASKGIPFALVQLGMDTACNPVEGTGYGDEIGFRDGISLPVFDTFRVLPWFERMGRILIEPTDQGEFAAGHPRVVARRQLDRLKDLGISLLSAHEHELYVVHKETMKPINGDLQAKAVVRNTPIQGFLSQIIDYLPQMGVSIEQVLSEYGPGQLEITYEPAFGICAVDNAHTYKTSIKEIAILNGYVASFMTKPYPGKSGSSAHFNHSLWDVEGKKSLLYDPDSAFGLSELGQHWIAGVLAHGSAIQVLMGPTVSCFKRIQPMTFVPLHSVWGIRNRTCLLRVKVNGEQGTYFENRGGAAACNPYLSLAARVAAGIDGIVNKLPLPPQVTGNGFDINELPPGTRSLPNNLEDALKELQDDKVICDALGPDFIKCFVAVKKHEAALAKKAAEAGDEEWAFNDHFTYL